MTKPTENELLDLYKTLAYLPNDAEGNPLTPFGNFCAGYEARAELADKEIAELQDNLINIGKENADLSFLNDTLKTENEQLKAQINELREDLAEIHLYTTDTNSFRTAGIALASTPQQNRQIIVDKVIEAVAQWVSVQRNDIPATGEEFESAIMLLKGKSLEEIINDRV